MVWGQLNQPTYASGYFPCTVFFIRHRTILEKDNILDIGVVMSKSGRRVGVILVSGVVWLDFDSWG
jgi:hypothetical protein